MEQGELCGPRQAMACAGRPAPWAEMNMANNLMAVVCKRCNKGVAKFYPSLGWGRDPERAPMRGQRPDAFLKRHDESCWDEDDERWQEEERYEIKYEGQFEFDAPFPEIEGRAMK
jgi:hypothetical protein